MKQSWIKLPPRTPGHFPAYLLQSEAETRVKVCYWRNAWRFSVSGPGLNGEWSEGYKTHSRAKKAALQSLEVKV